MATRNNRNAIKILVTSFIMATVGAYMKITEIPYADLLLSIGLLLYVVPIVMFLINTYKRG